MERAQWLLLMNTPCDVGRSAVQKSTGGQSHQIGNEKRVCVYRTDQNPDGLIPIGQARHRPISGIRKLADIESLGE
jgi:hypothetical protein